MFRPICVVLAALLLAPIASLKAVAAQEQSMALPSTVAVEAWDRRASADVLSRPARLHVSEVPLEEALLRLEESAEIKVGYSPSLLPRGIRVSCDCGDATVGQAVGTILRGTNLEISVLSDYVVIRERRVPETVPVMNAAWIPAVTVPLTSSLPPLRMAPLQEAQGTLTGRVVDAQTQQPLSVAQIYVTGLNLGVLTSSNGAYQIPNVPPGTHTIRAELIGYASQTQEVLVVSGETVTLDFALVTQALALDELVVVGYGTQSQATVSGSVSQITSTDLERNSASTLTQALVGRVQGISTRMQTGFEAVTGTVGGTNQIPTDGISDGRPGATMALQIRNLGEPLYVIDGVPTDDAQEFTHLNAADIESISILKDASAAVYGFRAANGVVLVETKRGQLDEAPQVRLDGWYGWQNLKRYNFKDLMNAYEYQFSRADFDNNRGRTPAISAEELELYRIGAPGYESTDHWDLVNSPNAPEYNVNASVSGGAGNVRYYLSAGHVNQTYNFAPDDNKFDRSNLTANLQTSLTDRLTIGTELRARYERHENVAVAGNIDPIRTFLLTIHNSWPFQSPYTGPNGDLINRDVRGVDRSVAILNQDVSGLQEDDRRQASGNFWAEYRFPFGLTAKGTVSAGNRLRQFDLSRKSFVAYSCNDDNTVCTPFEGSSRTRNQLKRVDDDLFGQLTLNYAEQFGGHSLSANGFWEAQGSEWTETWTLGETPTNYSPLFGLTDIQDLGNNWNISRRASVGGRLDYDYEQKYLVTALARYDGSYRYVEGKRWGFFPGFSLGWRLTEEAFLRDRLGWLDELKIRGSWGQSGREQGIADWGYLGGATYNVGDGSVLDGSLVTGARPRGLPVTNLTWVTSESSNIGVDFVMLNGRFSGELDLFQRKLEGLPAPRTDVLVPDEVGYTLPNENLDSDTNRGFEGVIRWSDRVGGFAYSVAPNVTLARLKQGSRYGERYENSWDRYRTGDVDRWEGVGFGYQVEGQFQTMEEIESHPVAIDGQGNTTLLPGDLIIRDVNGDGVINGMDQRPIGYSNTGTPILSFGATLDASYRGFGLSVVLAGGGLYTHQRNAATRLPGNHNLPTYAIDRWHREDPYNPQSEWIPGYYPPFRNGGGPSYGTYGASEFWYTNVKYVRLRRVELSYDVPDWFSNQLGLSGTRVYTSATNPFSLDNVGFYNHDPEVANSFDLVYPTISLVNIGVTTSVGGF